MNVRRLSSHAFLAVMLAAGSMVGGPRLVAAEPELGRVHEATGKRGMVVSASRVASLVGRDVLRQGGNAVDAAVTLPPFHSIGPANFTRKRSAAGEAAAAPPGKRRSAPEDRVGSLRCRALVRGPCRAVRAAGQGTCASSHPSLS